MATPKILYGFGYSLWSAAAELAVLELGYPEGAVTLKNLDLINGENFDPAFLKLNPNGTTAALEAGGKVYTSTTDVIAHLVEQAPRKVKVGTPAIIAAVHDDKYDPNFALLLARDETELTVKGMQLPGKFFANRQIALTKYAADPAAAAFKDFYESRLATNGALLAIYKHEATAEAQAAFFANSKAHWGAVRSALFEVYPALLPASGFIGGAEPGEDDFHMIAWITRIAWVAGARSGEEGLSAFNTAYGEPAPDTVAAYWRAWIQRPSWKKVYAETLH
ncbi:hypothetical protein K438DRAFT_1996590 [Mycena galopus ATCC 62051]|nr:hypothetical protein K438DRAFT_1996590 [Mycena galopus ATCC 62051]